LTAARAADSSTMFLPAVRVATSAARARLFDSHRPHRALNHASPLRALPDPVHADIKITPRDRLGGLLHEYGGCRGGDGRADAGATDASMHSAISPVATAA
jgi:hypothetical protein